MEERENKEIWIFLSHSNHDYEKVRKVRNMLEEQDLRPIMFFLKCLNDDDEIDDLIKREIDCRTRFILCDSENARQSKWVQKEINYIQEQQKPIERIDLSKSDTDILAQLTEVRRKSKLFISYAQEDRDLTVQIKQRLSKYDYDVFVDFDNLMPGSSFADTIKNAIDGAVYNGYIIAILTKEGIKSQWVSKEIEYARNFDAMRNINTQSVIPIAIGNEIPEICSGLNCIKISPYTDDLANQITDSLLNKLLMPGQILTYYNIFKKGTHRIPDNEESERLGAIYFKWAKEMDAQNYPPALKITLVPYNDRIGFEAGVGIFGQQAIPTFIMLFITWPVLLTQIWGMVLQSKLDDKALATAKQLLMKTAATLIPVDLFLLPCPIQHHRKVLSSALTAALK